MQIGNIKLENPFIAAPLAGICDAPTRSLFRSMGASLVCSEMISGKGLIFGNEKTRNLLQIYEGEHPVSLQVFGKDKGIMAKTAQMLDQEANDILDLNIGCPVPKIVKNGEGSAMMKEPELVYQVVKAMVENTDKPVTAKIRAGWDEQNINAVEVAKAIEEAGAKAVAVHGRTRSQYYSGKADRKIIKDVKEAVTIPVIGNGDIFTPEDAISMMNETGCDGVMIGRGMLGNPWIFRQCIEYLESGAISTYPSINEKVHIMKKHFQGLLLEKGERVAVNEMRKHFAWYIKGEHGACEYRRHINTAQSKEDVLTIIENLGSDLK